MTLRMTLDTIGFLAYLLVVGGPDTANEFLRPHPSMRPARAGSK